MLPEMDTFTFGLFQTQNEPFMAVIRVSQDIFEVIRAGSWDIVASCDPRELSFALEQSGVLTAFLGGETQLPLFQLTGPHVEELRTASAGPVSAFYFGIELASQPCKIAISSEKIDFIRDENVFYSVTLTEGVSVEAEDAGATLLTDDGEISLGVDPTFRKGVLLVLQYAIERQKPGMTRTIDDGLRKELASIRETATRVGQGVDRHETERCGALNLDESIEEPLKTIKAVSEQQEMDRLSIRPDCSQIVMETRNLNGSNTQFHTARMYSLYILYSRIEDQIFKFEAQQLTVEMQIRLLDDELQLLTCVNEQFRSYVYAGSTLVKQQTPFSKAVFRISPIPLTLKGDQETFVLIETFLENCNGALAAGRSVSSCFKYFEAEPNALARLKAAIDISEKKRLGVFYGKIGGRELDLESDEILNIKEVRAGSEFKSTELTTSGSFEVDDKIREIESGNKSEAEDSEGVSIELNQSEMNRPFLGCEAPIAGRGEIEFQLNDEHNTNLERQVKLIREVHHVESTDGYAYSMEFGYSRGSVIVKLQKPSQKMTKYRLGGVKTLGDQIMMWHSGNYTDKLPFTIEGNLTDVGSALEAVLNARRDGLNLGSFFD